MLQGDALTELKKLPDECIDTCVTSPPYWGLRDYGTALWVGGDETCDHSKSKDILKDLSGCKNGQIQGYAAKRMEKETCKRCGAVRVDKQLGLEKTPEKYIETMVAIFREIKRVLKEDGTLWVNIGDSYWGGKGSSGAGGNENDALRFEKGETLNRGEYAIGGKHKTRPQDGKHKFIKPKDLVGVPWMLAFALRGDGWHLRQDIIWHKPNPMPESVTDRCTKAHEYIFLLSKSNKYYYDQNSIRETASYNTHERVSRQVWDNKGVPDEHRNGIRPRTTKTPDGWDTGRGSHGSFHKNGREKGKKVAIPGHGIKNNTSMNEALLKMPDTRNKRSVWSVSPQPFPEAHFATFPEDLIVDCIKAGCPENGLVLDPFMGSGTTGLVARKLNRNFIGIELNEKYIAIAEKRLKKELGMFL